MDVRGLSVFPDYSKKNRDSPTFQGNPRISLQRHHVWIAPQDWEGDDTLASKERVLPHYWCNRDEWLPSLFALFRLVSPGRAPKAASRMFVADGDSLLRVVYVMIRHALPPPGLGVRPRSCRFCALWSVTALQGERP
jgi:hypothetical protein